MEQRIAQFFICFLSPLFLQSQIIINEVHADPNPSVGLPTEEFVELYNTSSETISLFNWQFSDASSSRTIEDEIELQPNAYIILCADEHEELFSQYGNVVTVSSLPSLNNSGDELTLISPTGVVSDFVAYENTWYNDPLKANGGWALERINPNNSCDTATNWTASNATNGGTPGQPNSVEDFNFEDDSDIKVESVYLIEQDLLQIVFSKAPDNNQIETLEAFSFTPQLSVLQSEASSNPTVIHIRFMNTLPENQIYELVINTLFDCNRITNVSGNFSFGRTTQAQRNDIVINEILFNPASGGVDFIEIVNRTDKLFGLDDLSILELDVFTDEVVDFETLENQNRYLLPDKFYVLTEDATILQEQYEVAHPERLIEANIPNWPDDAGKIALLNRNLDTLDALQYHENWHFEGLNRTDGVSLERLSVDQATQNKTNWFSASYLQGNATPTSPNSQNEFTTQEIGNTLLLSAEIFTPDNDGIDDFLTITFDDNSAGTTANVAVYDVRGFLVKTLVNNQLLGGFNEIRWTGLNEENQPVAIGHYFIVAEQFDSEGRKQILKEKVVVSRRR